MSERSLVGKRVLVTGGLGALAEHIVRTLVENGARVEVTDLPDFDTGGDAAASRWRRNPGVRYSKMDVTCADEVDRVVEELSASEPLDIAIGAAGGTPLLPFLETPREEFDRVFRLNFTAQTYLARAMLRSWTTLQRPGHLIFISSWVAQYPFPDIAAYSSAKAALEMFARNLALDYSRTRIRVNCVAPGIVAAGSALATYKSDTGYRQRVKRLLPLGHLSPSQAVADSVAFLCSDAAREYQGQVLRPDGGLSLPNIS